MIVGTCPGDVFGCSGFKDPRTEPNIEHRPRTRTEHEPNSRTWNTSDSQKQIVAPLAEGGNYLFLAVRCIPCSTVRFVFGSCSGSMFDVRFGSGVFKPRTSEHITRTRSNDHYIRGLSA